MIPIKNFQNVKKNNAEEKTSKHVNKSQTLTAYNEV